MNGVVAAAGASSRSLDVRVACDEDGVAWPTRRAIMGTGSEPTSSFFVIDCLAPWSFQSAPPCLPFQLPPPSWRIFLLSPAGCSPSSFCVSFSPFHLPSGTTSGRTPPRFFFSRRSLVSQTLAKPHLGDGLSCSVLRASRLALSLSPVSNFEV